MMTGSRKDETHIWDILNISAQQRLSSGFREVEYLLEFIYTNYNLYILL